MGVFLHSMAGTARKLCVEAGASVAPLLWVEHCNNEAYRDQAIQTYSSDAAGLEKRRGALEGRT